MPELAEVEYYRKRWDSGLGHRITAVRVHEGKRIFRDFPISNLIRFLPGSVLLASQAHGKQMLFRFSKKLWLGLHLGMTGQLRVETANFRPTKHDHLVLYQKERALVFSDPRLFGRIVLDEGAAEPDWWTSLPPRLTSDDFTPERMKVFLNRHARLPIKAALLLQEGFPGIGNWMADEILWRARVHPRTAGAAIHPGHLAKLWKTIRSVCAAAMKHISHDFSDPPRGWLFHERWNKHGKCPTHRIALTRETIGGRTTVWCSKCQRLARE